jgi:hypothetical protein
MFPKSDLFLSPFVLLLGFQSVPLATSQAAPSFESINLTVRFYNFAKIESYTVERAQKRISAILGQAGVELNWIPCPRNASEIAEFPACTPEIGPTDLIFKLVPKFDMQKNGFKKSAFGLSFGRSIIISCERLEDVAKNGEQTCEKILGLTVAHEIGHALLGSNSHSPRGIMRPHWDPEDLQKESRQNSSFTEEQIQFIHQRQLAQK